MKKLFPVLMILSILVSSMMTNAAAAPAALLTSTAELGQLKVCKVAGSGVEVGTIFDFRVNGSDYSVPAGPGERNGYCVLAGQYPVSSEVTIEEVIPDSYFVSRIEVKPDRTVSKDTPRGVVTVRIVSGVMETIFTNNKDTGTPTPTRTPTSIQTSTPRPTKTATSTPSCDPNCTATPTLVPRGRLQICKEAEGPGVIGSFTFRFEIRSRTVPVGACAGLISVDAGTLTITEDAQAGYEVANIYTLPADRLISKDLAAGVATVRIVEGTAASQTIVIFRNREIPPPSFTPTFTPTVTGTTTSVTSTFTPTLTTSPNGCRVIYADFTQVAEGQSVEGMGRVAPYLNIDATNGTAVRVSQGTEPGVYAAPNQSGIINGGLAVGGGFSDTVSQAAGQAHLYTFTFAPGISVTNFSLHMLDYGDLNPSLTIEHVATMTAYDANGQPIPGASQVLSYTTPPVASPRESSLYGDLYFTGDAVTALPRQPGNWIWNVYGNGIAKVVLEFGVGYDPNIAFDGISFLEGGSIQLISADFSGLQRGDSVEGLGRVAKELNIAAKGKAVSLFEENNPTLIYQAYQAPNGSENNNRGLFQAGGFSDKDARDARLPHLYTFTFAPGVSITNFSLHMLDYGDWNPTRSTDHYASATAYDANGNVISQEVLSFETDPIEFPHRATNLDGSNLCEDLDFCGDARADLGKPGNWVWNVDGKGIVRVVLEFDLGHDPEVAFDLLSFTRECAGCQPISADYSGILSGESVEGLGRVAPYLNIDAKGTALHLIALNDPVIYRSPNAPITTNGGLSQAGGFSDLTTRNARPFQPPRYTFTFTPPENGSIIQFSLRMLDFGDWNPEKKTSHKVTMTAYDANGNVISQDVLSYTTDPNDATPQRALTSDLLTLCEDLYFCGDAVTAFQGQPGNWVWNVAGNGIMSVELRFGIEEGDEIDYGYDPNIAFDTLSYVMCQ